jgi:hypothetical protein
VQIETICAALDESLKYDEWSDVLLLVGAKNLNSALKSAQYSKEDVVSESTATQSRAS